MGQRRFSVTAFFMLDKSFKAAKSHAGEVELLCTFAPNDEYGHEGQAYISEFIISQDASGISAYPTFITLQEGDYDTYE